MRHWQLHNIGTFGRGKGLVRVDARWLVPGIYGTVNKHQVSKTWKKPMVHFIDTRKPAAASSSSLRNWLAI